MKKLFFSFLIISLCFLSCKKSEDNPAPTSETFSIRSFQVNDKMTGFSFVNVAVSPIIKITFSTSVKPDNLNSYFFLKDNNSNIISTSISIENDSIIIIKPTANLNYLSKYTFTILPSLKSKSDVAFNNTISASLSTVLDLSDKFPQISDSDLLDLVQKQTFKYFWDFGHPISGLARERNSSGDVVTIGGSGFGIMSILVGIKRNFISRQDGLNRLLLITNFLKNNVVKYYGAFPHWLNGSTGATVPFSPKDNGADLVETSYLMQGLLTARQYFNDVSSTDEVELKNTINELYNNVEWTWFQQNNQNVLYWHWSPDNNFAINAQITGWDEALITYVMAASSPTFSISKSVYDAGWARSGAMVNNKTFYGNKLPLGPDNGGPLFFAHYSFLGLNPHKLSDNYADYWNQNVAHSLINYNYCKANPKNYNGYSDQCWGLTASDDNITGYSAHEPNNDLGIISPTAAISSIPYTPLESMTAIKFFYYKLGDKTWKSYGFVDAFNLTNPWFADSFLAIDQGPEIIMIENYRSNMLWDLFMSCPEVNAGLIKLGFQIK